MVVRTEPTLWLALVAFLGAAIAGVLGVLFWQRRDKAGAQWFGVEMVANTLWLAGFGLELLSTTLPGAIFWFRLRTVGLIWVPVAWYAFVAEYTGTENPVSRRTLALLSVFPAIASTALLTNGIVHSLSWTAPQFVESSRFVVLEIQRGPLWWLGVFYSYIVISLGFWLLLRHRQQSVHRYRRQTDLILTAAMPAGVVNAIYHFEVLPWLVFDPTPFAFVLLGLLIFLALFRHGLFDLAPVARRSVVETMDDGMLVLSTDRRIIDVNPAASRLVDTDSPVGTSIEDSFPELSSLLSPLTDATPTASRADTTPFGPGVETTPVEMETDELVLHQGGQERVFDVKVSALTDRTEEVTGWTVVLHDVTERKHREETLSELQGTTQEMMRPETVESVCEQVVTATPDVVGLPLVAIHLRRDDTLQPVAYTDEVVELYETPPSFAVGEGLQGMAYDRGETVVFDDQWADDAASGLDSEVASALVIPLGEYGVLCAASTSETTLDDETVHFAEVMAASATTAIARADREETIRERERELEQQNDRLEEFANVVSHDLRNPLTVAYGHTEHLDDADHADAIQQALDRMEEIIDDVLTLAQQGEPVRNPGPVSLATVAADAWELADTETATVSVEDDLHLLADGSRLQQLLENLFRNAVDHGGADVTVRVGPLTDREGFYVEDDGPGIPADERDRVFESGFSTDTDGTGFGLAIVRQVVEDHGWAVTATESDAGGARFEITGVAKPATPEQRGGTGRR